MKIPTFAALFALSVSVSVIADEHHDHDHDHAGHQHEPGGHEHHAGCRHGCEPAGEKAAPESLSWMSQLGLKLEMVEMRAFVHEEVIAVPQSAILYDSGKTFVLAQAGENGARFERWEVTLGKINGRFVEAKTGLFPGDHVVTRAPSLFTAIEPAPMPMRGDSSGIGCPDCAAGNCAYGSQDYRAGVPETYRSFAPQIVPSPLYTY